MTRIPFSRQLQDALALGVLASSAYLWLMLT